MNLAQMVITWIRVVGEFSVFTREVFRTLPSFWKRRGLFFQQCEYIGVSSTGITVVSGIFMGAVLGYELYVGFHTFGAEALLGASVGVALFRDLAPVMAAFMVTGRAGSSMAARIASMRISEQIDALEVMAVDPIEYLVMPRVVAGILMMPILAMLFGGVASLSASWVATGVFDLSVASYWYQFTKFVDWDDLMQTVVKGGVFGALLSCVACFYGYRAQGGARGVGLATRATVVVSLLVILFSDYILTALLPYGFTSLKVE